MDLRHPTAQVSRRRIAQWGEIRHQILAADCDESFRGFKALGGSLANCLGWPEHPNSQTFDRPRRTS